MTARIARTSCLLAAVASLLVLSPATARAAPTLPGIDVSKWQQTIDWSKVAGAGMRFAIARATKGQHYIDPTFQTNVDGARAEGIVVGAYHRATPSGGANANTTDARAEADHYLDVASPGVGDLIPALDIEETGGLAPPDLVVWVKAWVTRVTNRLGVKPMLYASPNFWTVNMGNSTWFADHGYRLWLAHWNVSSPTVPANGWQGRGWTFWQWTHKPGMPGVTTDLDRDRFDGTNLVTARIARLTAVPGAGGSVTDVTGRLSCGDGASCAALFDPSAIVTLTATPDPGAVFLRWGGACSGSSPTCSVTTLGKKTVTATFGYPLSASAAGPGGGIVSSSPAGISCASTCSRAFPAGSSVSLTASPDGASEFDTWSGDCVGLDANACTVTLDQPRSVTARFTDLGPPSAAITTPSSLTGAVHIAFSEPVHRLRTDNVVLRAAGGGAVTTALTCRGADGTAVSCSKDLVLSARLRPASPLVAGQSYLVVANPDAVTPTIVDRAANPLPKTTASFRAATAVSEEASGSSFTWGARDDPRAMGGSYRVERRVGASITLGFSGPTVTLWTVAGPAFGRARIDIDGRYRTTIDRYRPSFAVVPRTFTRSGRGAHTLQVSIVGPGPGHPSVVGTGVDAIADGNGTRRAPPGAAARWGAETAASAVGGRYVASSVASARASFRFRGPAVTITTATGPRFGRAEIWVDGTLKRRIDLSAATTTFGVARTVGGLTDRVHTVRIVVLGLPGKAGTGTAVAIDGWTVA
jgi:GH25 family lysozyme M1 (1,4-beta-N-acetylmuramidase)